MDQWSRPALLGLGLALWSVCTAASGFARSFTHLALLRSGVGIGEATLTPTVISFLGDYLALPRTRGVAAAVYLFIFNGVGLLLGPALFAVLTDKAFGDPAMLWRSLAFAAPSIAALAAVLSLVGLRPYRACVAATSTTKRPPWP